MDKTSSGYDQRANLRTRSKLREKERQEKMHRHSFMFLDCGQTKAELPIHGTATEERSR